MGKTPARRDRGPQCRFPCPHLARPDSPRLLRHLPSASRSRSPFAGDAIALYRRLPLATALAPVRAGIVDVLVTVGTCRGRGGGGPFFVAREGGLRHRDQHMAVAACEHEVQDMFAPGDAADRPGRDQGAGDRLPNGGMATGPRYHDKAATHLHPACTCSTATPGEPGKLERRWKVDSPGYRLLRRRHLRAGSAAAQGPTAHRPDPLAEIALRPAPGWAAKRRAHPAPGEIDFGRHASPVRCHGRDRRRSP